MLLSKKSKITFWESLLERTFLFTGNSLIIHSYTFFKRLQMDSKSGRFSGSQFNESLATSIKLPGIGPGGKTNSALRAITWAAVWTASNSYEFFQNYCLWKFLRIYLIRYFLKQDFVHQNSETPNICFCGVSSV